MITLLPKETAAIILIVSLVLLAIFHLLVAYAILPQDIVWAGTLEKESVKTYELISFAVTMLLLFFAVIKAGYINNTILIRIADVFIWLMVLYFGMMVIGNFSAKTITEMVIFIPLSILMFVASLRLAIERR